MTSDLRPSIDALTGLVDGRGTCTVDGPVVLLLPNEQGWPIRILAEREPVRVLTGSASRIVVGADGDDLWSPVLEVVDSVLDGRAEEYFGTDDEGPLTPIGYRVWGAGGERRALDDEAAVVEVHRAPAWR